MSRYRIGTVTYDGLGPAASALTRDMELDDVTALDLLLDAHSRQPDSNDAMVVVVERIRAQKGATA